MGLPSPSFSISHVEPYNALIANMVFTERRAYGITFDNQALYRYIRINAGMASCGYEEINT
jgi:hypothetical protein